MRRPPMDFSLYYSAVRRYYVCTPVGSKGYFVKGRFDFEVIDRGEQVNGLSGAATATLRVVHILTFAFQCEIAWARLA